VLVPNARAEWDRPTAARREQDAHPGQADGPIDSVRCLPLPLHTPPSSLQRDCGSRLLGSSGQWTDPACDGERCAEQCPQLPTTRHPWAQRLGIRRRSLSSEGRYHPGTRRSSCAWVPRRASRPGSLRAPVGQRLAPRSTGPSVSQLRGRPETRTLTHWDPAWVPPKCFAAPHAIAANGPPLAVPAAPARYAVRTPGLRSVGTTFATSILAHAVCSRCVRRRECIVVTPDC
jgi:hypothetical protein